MKKVKDYMKKKVVFFEPEDSIFKVAKTFSKHNISGAPVVDVDRVVGVISESDVIKFLEVKMPRRSGVAEEPHVLAILMADFVKQGVEFLAEMRKVAKSKVKDFMSKEVVSISPDATLLEAAEIMDRNKVNRLPVMQKDKLVGIIAKADLIRALVE